MVLILDKAKAQQEIANGNILKYNEAKGQYYWTNKDNVNIYLTAAEAAGRNPTQYANLTPVIANKEWASKWEPQWNKYGEQMQRGLQTAFDRSYADAQGKLGYGLSMSGSGEGGLAEASRLALTQEAQNKRMDIAATRDQMLQQAYIQFMTTKDQQAFDMAKMAAGYAYQQKMAEMNQTSWWSTLGSILGMAAGIVFAPATGGLSLIGTAASGANLGGTLSSNLAPGAIGQAGSGTNW
jgi:hypothetical protein